MRRALLALGVALCTVLVGGFCAGPALAAGVGLTQTFAGANGDQFGQAVAVSGNTMVVGAPATGEGTSGTALVYTQNSAGVWIYDQTLAPSPVDEAVQFGESVAISGGTIVVGAPGESNIYSGSAWVFLRDSGGVWSLTEPLGPVPAVNSTPDADVGQSVAVSSDGDTIAVGAPDTGCLELSCGAAYIYTRVGSGYSPDGMITPPSSDQGSDYFGYAVAISGQAVFVGEPDVEIGSDYDAGAVYGYIAGTGAEAWDAATQTADLHEVASAAQFGDALAAQGSTLVVGAPGVGEQGVTGSVGAGFAYDVSAGGVATGATELQPGLSGGTSYPEYGTTLAVDGSSVVLGPYGTDDPCVFSTTSGSTGVCEALPEANLGGGVAVSGGTIAVGNPYAGSAQNGAVYVFGQPATSISVALSPSSIVANGTSTTTVTASVGYPSGDAAADEAVTFSASPLGVTIGPMTNNGDGTYTATITSSTTAGAVTITATDSAANIEGSGTLTQTAPPSSGGGSGGSGGGGTGGGTGGTGGTGGGTGGTGGSSPGKLPPRKRLLRGLGSPTGKLATIKAILRSRDYGLKYTAVEAGVLTDAWYSEVGRKRVLVATGSLRINRAESVTLKLNLTSAGRALFRRDAKLKVSFKASFTPTGKTALTEAGSFTLR